MEIPKNLCQNAGSCKRKVHLATAVSEGMVDSHTRCSCGCKEIWMKGRIPWRSCTQALLTLCMLNFCFQPNK